MNETFHPDFVVDGGDFIDGTRRFGEQSEADFSILNQIFQQAQAPKYMTLGNHDLRGMTRETWIEKTGSENSHYFFDFNEKLRVIFFDSNLITSSQDPNDPKKIAYEKQLIWLEDVLSGSKNKKIIIFSHHPLAPKFSPNLEKTAWLNDLLSRYRVKAVFSGHVETLNYTRLNGVDYFISPGFYRSEKKSYQWFGSFSEISIGLKNHLTLHYKESKDYQAEYKRILIPSEDYYRLEKELEKKINPLTDKENSIDPETSIEIGSE
jgi:3',5'-cyclic AMP phosphodiesterase CpdA